MASEISKDYVEDFRHSIKPEMTNKTAEYLSLTATTEAVMLKWSLNILSFSIQLGT